MAKYVRPIPSLDPARPPEALPLAGGPGWFDRVECLSRDAPPEILPISACDPVHLATLSTARAAIAGIAFDQPRLMGIVNVTPDSFSDGGQYHRAEAAVAHGKSLAADGADLLDIGGESTRPGAVEVPSSEEADRIAPVIAGLRAALDLPLSLDTRKAVVAQAGLAAGDNMINDVSGLRFDPALADVTAQAGAPLIVMHSIGTPETMQGQAERAYADILLDVYDGLAAAVAQAEAAGIPRNQIIVDPGIGFGKTQAQNLALIRRISLFHGLGCVILLGVSRKGFIGKIGQEPNAAQRGPGSAAVGLWALSQGVQILRAHDIRAHAQAIRLWQAAHAVSV
ncbi:dihydropteroate synthase [Gymnodinialimonas sp. 2305UL16-5]|uniref:dihydropteroate synthase n=1 Tax=Gymnodinialimonas mytili TaxID=3126503 RepID=UPI0030B6B393